MFSSVEVRWFYPGEIPDKVQTWFGGIATEVIEQAPREDIYLLSTHAGKFGIKLRENRIEVKEKEHVYGDRQLGHQVVGAIESWNKVSFGLEEDQHNYFSTQNLTPSWIAITKTRQLSEFYFKRYNPKTDTLFSFSVEACHLELTKIEVQDQYWWTLGLEAYGADDKNFDHLLQRTGQFFSEELPFQLDLEHSYGYPQWLNQLGT